MSDEQRKAAEAKAAEEKATAEAKAKAEAAETEKETRRREKAAGGGPRVTALGSVKYKGLLYAPGETLPRNVPDEIVGQLTASGYLDSRD
jgi:FKBP-type peptidyl-prolyl cis-trans isomerase